MIKIILLFCISLSLQAQEPAGKEIALTVDPLWVIVSAALVFFMQAGFLMLETGLSRLKNNINVALKNLMDYIVGTMAYFVVGFGLMFGISYDGLVGSNLFFLEGISTGKEYAFFLFQVAFMGTAATIVSGAVAERIKFSAYLFVSLLVSTVIYPIFGHWAWGGGWLAAQGFVDFAGSTVVHSLGGWVSLAGVILLGARKDKFSPNGIPKKIQGHNLTFSVLGVFILWFGWFGFNGGSTLAFTDAVPLIIVNTTLCASAGGLLAIFSAWLIYGISSVEDCMNGVLGGLVAVTAGCHALTPMYSVLLGAIAGSAVVFITWGLEHLFHLDDVVSAFPVHGACGAIGTLLLPSFTNDPTIQFVPQLIGVTSCAIWAFSFGFIVFWILKNTIGIRVEEGKEDKGLNISEHGSGSSWIDLIHSLKELSKGEGDLTKKINVDQGTEAGAIAYLMNKYLSSLGKMIYTIKIKSSELDHSSNEISASWQSISQGIQTEAASLEEISSIFDQFKESFHLISNSAEEQQEIENKAHILLNDLVSGFQKIDTELEASTVKSESSLKEISSGRNNLENLVSGMNKIGSSAQKVEQIVKVLSEISGKLGMLSINASIEAARSGEAGRGFGVVASEINNLSTTTSENTRKAVQILGEIKDAVTSGRTIVNGTVQTFGSITTQFRDIAKLQFEIRNKSSEYSGKLNSLDNLNSELSEKSKFIFRDIKERNNDIMDLYKSIDDISKTFYEISERSEELTSTGEFLKQLSETLNSLVGKFKVEEKESPVTLKILPT
ncbi:MAG: ammonium transporter [Leptospiraceae bacterium]|nr:ammonium transporter [Leptospiraceae bacterium]